MTDPFEEAVRAAGRGLATSEPPPTYHGAWKRGRRRKLAKRSALAIAGALALVVALGADVGRFQRGGTTIEVDDIASESELVPASTAPVVEPTTAPVITTDLDQDEADSPQSGATQAAPDLDLDTAAFDPNTAGNPAAEAANGDDTAGSVSGGSASDGSTAPEGSAGGVSPAGSAPAVVATPTPVPSTTPVPPAPEPTVVPTTTPEVGAARDTDPTPQAETATLLDPNQPTDDAPDGQTDGDKTGEAQTDHTQTDHTETGPTDLDPGKVDLTPPNTPQESTFNRLGLPADARIAPASASDQGRFKCDTDGDGTPDAVCEVLAIYGCTSPDQARPGFQAVDLNGDGAFETCVPLVETTCDTTGDGIANVTCRIELASDGKSLTGEGP